MTIKELETLSGMSRANIRYYEQEGLLHPHRDRNGYRNYTQEDLDSLKKIYLLRFLKLSLEEIRRIQSEEIPLYQVVEQKIDQLVRDRSSAGIMAAVGRRIAGDGITYETLQPQIYLDYMDSLYHDPLYNEEIDGEQNADRTEDENLVSKETAETLRRTDIAPQVFAPWRRFFARSLDFALCQLLWWSLLGFAMHINLLERSKSVDGLICVGITLILEPFFLAKLGTTPGKWLLGLRIEDENGARLHYDAALERTWNVIRWGLGYRIPIWTWIQQWRSYERSQRHQAQPWEKDQVYVISHLRRYQVAIYLLVCALSLGGIAATIFLPALPPHRGDLTVAEFADNFNYMSSYYRESIRMPSGPDFTIGSWMCTDGSWKADTVNGDYHVDLEPLPEMEYTVENHVVTGIRAVYSAKGELVWRFGNRNLKLMALAYAGAQKELGPVSDKRLEMTTMIGNLPFEDYDFTIGQVRIRCHVEKEGYERTGVNELTPVDKDASFRLEFTMIK